MQAELIMLGAMSRVRPERRDHARASLQEAQWRGGD
jgi:hypothetical protein